MSKLKAAPSLRNDPEDYREAGGVGSAERKQDRRNPMRSGRKAGGGAAVRVELDELEDESDQELVEVELSHRLPQEAKEDSAFEAMGLSISKGKDLSSNGNGGRKKRAGRQYAPLGGEDDTGADSLLDSDYDSYEQGGLGPMHDTQTGLLQSGEEVNDGGDGVTDTAMHNSCECIHGRALVYLCAVCSSLSSVLLGYDVGVMSGAKEYMTPDLGLTQTQEEIVVGSLNLVAAFGGLLAGSAADTLGRRMAILLSSIIFISGASVMVSASDFETMLAGRIVTGLGVGCAMVVAPVYITELAPPDVRGMLVSLTDICINLGILFGYASSLACDVLIDDDGAKWRSMIGIGIIPPALIVLCLIFMPESPRWLLNKGRKQEGYDVLRRIMGSPAEARDSLHEMSKSIEEHAQQEPSWAQVLFPSDEVRRYALVIGLGLGFWQQASGSEAAVYYSPEVLEGSGWGGSQLLLGTMAVGAFKLAGEVIAFFLLDVYGRRPLLIISAASSTVCIFFLALSFSLQWSGVVLLSWLCAFMLCFSIGIGPVTFVVASEVFPLVMRSKAMGLVIFVNRFMSGIIALTYESVASAMTPAGSFYMFAALSAMSVLFYAWEVPETFGKSLEDITSELEDRVALRKGLQSPHSPSRDDGKPVEDNDWDNV